MATLRLTEPATLKWNEPIAVAAGSAIRIVGEWRKAGLVAPVLSAGLLCLNDAGAVVAFDPALKDAWAEASELFVVYSQDVKFADLPAGTAEVWLTLTLENTADLELIALGFEDVSSEVASGEFAEASETSRLAAETAQAAAELAESASVTARTGAEAAEANAQTSATLAATSETNAGNSATAASTSASEAATSASDAAGSASAAATSETNAAASESAAGASATAASSSASAAATSASDAAGSASQAGTSETNAAASEAAAGASATAASSSASSAATSASDAAGSASAAGTSETNAAASESAAGGSATAAANSASAAATSASDAAGSASAASTSETNAAASETAAGGSATAAANSASSAATSASDAAGSASAASTSETNSAASETAAGGSATAAATSASSAATSASDAAGSAAEAASSRDLSVETVGQGEGVLETQFLKFATGHWTAWITGPTVTANEVYPTGETFAWTLDDVTNAGVVTRSDWAGWTGPADVEGFEIALDLELVSGSADGLFVLIDWWNTGGSFFRTTLDLSEEDISVGGLSHVHAVLERDAAFTGTLDFVIVYLLTNWSTLAAKTVKVHRFLLTPIGAGAAAALAASASAGVSEAAAAVSASDAAGSAAAAVATQTATARLLGGGAIDNPVFADWSGADPEGWTVTEGAGGSSSKVTDQKYGNALELGTADPVAAGLPFIEWDNLVAGGSMPPAHLVTQVLVTLEIELASGSWGADNVIVSWKGTSVVSTEVDITADLNSSSTIQKLEFFVDRPATYVQSGGSDEMKISYRMSAATGNAVHEVRVHRLDIQDASAASLAAQVSYAYATSEGLNSAGHVLKAVSGGAVGEMRIFAVDDLGGSPVSGVTFTADYIKLDSGMAHFTGDLQSDNYVADTSGWKISKGGDIEARSLTVYGDMIDTTAVVEGEHASTLGISTLGDGTVIAQTASFDVAGGVLVMAAFEIEGNGVAGHYCELRRGTIVLQTLTLPTIADDVWQGFTMQTFDVPSDGSYSYNVRFDKASGGTVRTRNREITAIDFKQLGGT